CRRRLLPLTSRSSLADLLASLLQAVLVLTRRACRTAFRWRRWFHLGGGRRLRCVARQLAQSFGYQRAVGRAGRQFEVLFECYLCLAVATSRVAVSMVEKSE